MISPAVVLVTGASSGIGEATALRCAGRGDHLVLAARGESALERVAEECRSAGAASVLVMATDVRDDAAVARLVARAHGEHGRLDVVAHCAGVVAYGRLEDVPVEVFDGVLDTNLHGSANVARHVLPVLREQGEGSLVLVGSVIGHVAAPQMTAYAVSKWGVRALARQLKVENRDVPGVHVGYVAPGGVDTPIYTQAGNFAGAEGRPPFPVIGPDTVARRILAVAEDPSARSQVGPANGVMRLGFTALPWAFDRLVGPMFRVAAQDLGRVVAPNTGNVLESRPEGNALRGGFPNALVSLGRNLAVVARGGRP